MSFKPTQNDADYALNKLEFCVTEICEWMTDNFLKLNDDKSDFIVFGFKCLRDKVNIPHFRIGNSSIVPAGKDRNLGAYFGMDMTLNHHISDICKSSSFHLRNIGLIRKYLTNDAILNNSSMRLLHRASTWEILYFMDSPLSRSSISAAYKT